MNDVFLKIRNQVSDHVEEQLPELGENVALYYENMTRKIMDNVLKEINTEQKSLSGTWRGRLASKESPQNYIDLEISGYSSNQYNNISCTLTKVRENEVVEIKDFSNGINTEVLEDDLIEAFLRVRYDVTDYVEEQLPELGENVVSYSNYEDKTIGQHFKLLEEKGFSGLPDYSKYIAAHPEESVKVTKMYVGFADIRGEENSDMMGGSSPEKTEKAAELAEAQKDMKPHQKSPYIGYAYAKNIEKPQVVFGSSPEEILEKLGKWNQSRPQESKYKTCNIGAYDAESEKYQDFEKYNIETGKSMKKIYLQVPKNIDKETFEKTIATFKENGAKFDVEKKRWYIADGMQEKFKDYLLGNAKATEAAKVAEPVDAQKDMKPHRKSPYIGYANISSEGKPQVVFGSSPEEILEKLGKWNQSRPQERKYKTCNIGAYDAKSDKYKDFVKYNAKTGKPLKRIYLYMPQDAHKEEFDKYVKSYKEEGAHFDAGKKSWYIFEGDKLPKGPGLGQEEAKTLLEETTEDVQRWTEENPPFSALQNAKSLGMQYEIEMENGITVHINQQQILNDLGVTNLEDVNNKDLLYALDNRVYKYMQTLEKGTMALKDPISEMNAVPEMQIGDHVKLNVPVYTTTDNGYREISGIKTVEGTLRSIDEKTGIPTLEMDGGEQKSFNIFYDKRQAEIINRAVSKEMTSEQINLIADCRFSAAQMEQIYNGFRDGLSIYQIAQYATPTWEAWQMDLYRYGMGNGLAFGDIKDVVTTCPVWEDSRRLVDHMMKAQRNLIIKDLKDNHFMPEKRLVSKIEKLNGLSGKLNSVKEIRSMCAEGAGNKSEIGKLRSEIEKEFKHQQNCRLKMQSAPAAAIPAR